VVSQTIDEAARDLPTRARFSDDVGPLAAHLAIGWAREQIRVALAEALERGRAARVVRADIDADVLAWLWLAACEAIAHEPPSAVGDRADTLAAFLTRA